MRRSIIIIVAAVVWAGCTDDAAVVVEMEHGLTTINHAVGVKLGVVVDRFVLNVTGPFAGRVDGTVDDDHGR